MHFDEKGVIELGDSNFPFLLTQISSPPKQLFFEGNLEALKPRAVAIVGSRKASEYGKWVAYSVAKRLGKAGITIVSGMAEGIDSSAHKGALDANAKTIAVMGNGVDICYPKINKSLRAKILEQGLIISEYPDGTEPAKYTFPARNRIISGLSEAIVIVEAGLVSGSLITAEFAVDQGRELYAVPGNIDRKSSIGCNKLIRDGVKPLVFIDDILEDLNIFDYSRESLKIDMNEDEKRIYDALIHNGEISIDALAQLTELKIEKVVSIMSIMEIKGIICYAAGKVFAII